VSSKDLIPFNSLIPTDLSDVEFGSLMIEVDVLPSDPPRSF